jgi:hypothetical protein
MIKIEEDSGNDSDNIDNDDPDYEPDVDRSSSSSINSRRGGGGVMTGPPTGGVAKRRRDSTASNFSTSSSGSNSSSGNSAPSAKGNPVPKAKITHWLLKVLRSPEHNPSVMRWEDEENGVFRVVDQAELGKMWGVAKNNPDMDYEKFR